MNNSTFARIAATGLLLISSSSVMANMVGHSTYKMVLIEDTPGMADIQSGDATKGIIEAQSAPRKIMDNFTKNLHLCVAYTRLSQLEDAKKSCAAAVKAATTKTPQLPSLRMRAYAYNNSGVMKVLANDNEGALLDFKRAASAMNDSIYKQNLALLEASLNDTTEAL